ncbi:MAG: neutral/alkaline non-lysosomal ceramidase N-terminal domain-containing protein [Candidatus Hydrogenedentes bacterium]|nr:neutral/alkaline non-lysosomal ceramidase N-terminal domain-containing protein [Candidatus Hydrogenedentota bacterium]
MKSKTQAFGRRSFLRRAVCAGSLLGASAGPQVLSFAQGDKTFRAGEAHVDATPPLEIELAGFHYPVGGTPRHITGIRQPAAVRALVLEQNLTQVALVSLDIAAVSEEMSRSVGKAVAEKTGIPASNVRLCATHTHSMPTFAYWRQWGLIPEEYRAAVEAKIVEAVVKAQADCAEAALFVGGSPAEGGNFNRTSKTWKNEAEFGPGSSDADRWLDRLVQVLYLERAGGKPGILWYHFASHPVCYNDGQAGPDWPGLVTDRITAEYGMVPSFLQGHAGDVNPGDGVKWIGEAEPSANAVVAAIDRAMSRLERIPVDGIGAVEKPMALPLDLERYRQWLSAYAENPAACASGVWVDAGFAKEWYEASVQKNWTEPVLRAPASAIRLGSVGLAFHPSELFSYYGLAIRRQSPFDHTLVTGYADGSIGYVTDPAAYNEGDGGIYAAVTVPKIIDIPPFTPEAGRELAAAMIALLRSATV